MAQTLNSDWIKGLKFTGSTPKKEKTEDGMKTRHVPFERALQVKDVLDFKLTGAGLVIVAGDGQKHTVELTAAERKKLEAELTEQKTESSEK